MQTDVCADTHLAALSLHGAPMVNVPLLILESGNGYRLHPTMSRRSGHFRTAESFQAFIGMQVSRNNNANL